MSAEFEGWCNENEHRYEANCETTQVTRDLEAAGRDGEARALRFMENQLQVPSSTIINL